MKNFLYKIIIILIFVSIIGCNGCPKSNRKNFENNIDIFYKLKDIILKEINKEVIQKKDLDKFIDKNTSRLLDELYFLNVAKWGMF